MSSNNRLCRNPIFSSPKLCVLSEAELLLCNWLNFISGEMQLALAQFGEACSRSLVFFSPPGQDNTLQHLCVSRVLYPSCPLLQLERMLGSGGCLRSLQQRRWAPGVLQGGLSPGPRDWASELLLEPVDPGPGPAACKIQPWAQWITFWGVKKKKKKSSLSSSAPGDLTFSLSKGRILRAQSLKLMKKAAVCPPESVRSL